jgi:hypothetical protein
MDRPPLVIGCTIDTAVAWQLQGCYTPSAGGHRASLPAAKVRRRLVEKCTFDGGGPHRTDFGIVILSGVEMAAPLEFLHQPDEQFQRTAS